MTADTPLADLLSGLLDAFNAHDIDRVMSFLPTIASFGCLEDPAPMG